MLTNAGFRVVLFDHRDCGAAANAPHGYLLSDMADDVAAVIGQAGAGGAVHVLGAGMGGTIALHLALMHPSLVRSLVVIGTTPGRSDDALPDPTPELVDSMVARAWAGPPVSREEQVVWLVELAELLTGSRYPFDEAGEVGRAAAQVDLRPVGRESGHGHAVVETRSIRELLDQVVQPTLVLHGTEDPVYPLAHGEAVANGVQRGLLQAVDGMGHEVGDGFFEEFGDLVIAAMRAADERASADGRQ